MKKYRCGECGKTKHKIFKSKGNKDFPIELIVECCKCKSQTRISLRVNMCLDIGNEKGSLAIF